MKKMNVLSQVEETNREVLEAKDRENKKHERNTTRLEGLLEVAVTNGEPLERERSTLVDDAEKASKEYEQVKAQDEERVQRLQLELGSLKETIKSLNEEIAKQRTVLKEPRRTQAEDQALLQEKLAQAKEIEVLR